ncbi:LexA family protein [Hydromonas duriensis]|uniref:SOS response UmuD protein n=1 Tax=Hydromonas duriensis TaxID=1527608 RepID=A0A4R6Y0L9_9BURK|nr:translesion error-prone DNA polymerase V autoproteolytic subunit [Hydromonas duriensis]TDR27781.1 SOS response UmuD protein [Hydromonas duriensis]
MSENKHGGARQGAGRKKGEDTIVKRVPIKLVDHIDKVIATYKGNLPADVMHVMAKTHMQIPLATEGVQAGFPSPAAPYLDDYIDLNEYLISNAAATILVRVKGQSMIKVGIDEGDILIVDRSVEALHTDIVVAELDGEFTVKRLVRTATGVELHPENDDFPILRPGYGSIITVVGVVMSVIKKFK